MPTFTPDIAFTGLRWRVGSNFRREYPYHLIVDSFSLCGLPDMDRGVQWAPSGLSEVDRSRAIRPYWAWGTYCRECANTARMILRGEATELPAVPPEGETQRESDSTRPAQWMGAELPAGVQWHPESFSSLGDTYSLGLSDGSTYVFSRRAGAELGSSFAECVRQAEGLRDYELRGRSRAEILGEFVRYEIARRATPNRGIPRSASAYTERFSGSGYRARPTQYPNADELARLLQSWTSSDTSSR